MTKHITIVFLLLLALTLQAQENPRYSSILVGAGTAAVYDTYLSPLEYSGTNYGILFEQRRRTGLGSGNISSQHLWHFQLSDTDNPAGTATNYVGSLDYGYGLFYHPQPVYRIHFFAGLQANVLAGGIYNSRNGNNPATAKLHLSLNLSGGAEYAFKICQQPLRLRYQLITPLAGAMYSPEYGQSYYEIDMNNYKGVSYFSSLHNYLALRNLLSVELPLQWATLKAGYTHSLYETRINEIDTRLLSGAFYIGCSRNFIVR